MELLTDADGADANSRIVGIRLVLLSLRLRDNWIRLFGDAETAKICLAVIATVSERLLRVDLNADLKSLSHPVAFEELTSCNISAIAAATGLNRETARRKVDQLIAKGMLVREAGSIMLAPGFTQQESVSAIVRDQLDELRRTTNALLQTGALKVRGTI